MHVLAESGIHLEALEACGHPRLTIHRVDTRDGEALARATFTLISVWIRLHSHMILANTRDSARILAAARKLLPHIDRRAFLYLRDFLWLKVERPLAELPDAGIIVPHELVLERQG